MPAQRSVTLRAGRQELQADCRATGTTTRTASPTAVPRSPAAGFTRGYESGEPAACDTYSPDEV